MIDAIDFTAFDDPCVRVTAMDNLPLASIQPDPDEYDDHAAYSWDDSHEEWDEIFSLVF